MIGKRFAKTAVDALVAAGVIELACKHYANNGAGRARLYRLSPDYADAPRAWKTYRNRILAKKLRCFENVRSHDAAQSFPSGSFLSANLLSVTVSPEGEAEAGARSYASPSEQAAWLTTIHSLNSGNPWLSRCERSGRVFHPVTSCPRKLRPFLKIDGEDCAEVDMACAQFFLLLGLYREPSAERERFAEVVSAGQLYEYLFGKLCEMDQGGTWGGIPDLWIQPNGGEYRDAFKKHAIQKLLYERIYTGSAPVPLCRVFAEAFPILAGLLAMQRTNKTTTRRFCLGMQTAEADLVIGRVLPAIGKELPGCKPITIHDALMCQTRFANDVQAIMVRETEALYGMKPLARIKPYVRN
jgi:hypothetical protein